GKLMTIHSIREHGPVKVLDPEEIPDDALVAPIAMMGAPTVMTEKGIGVTEYKALYELVSAYCGKEIYAFMPLEVGGINSLIPIAAAAQLEIPVVDADGMGRAFPELQMMTFAIGGSAATPMALTDEKGNSAIINTITNKWAEDIARAITMTCGAAVSVSLYWVTGKQIKEYAVKNTLSQSAELGKTIRTIKNREEGTPEENFFRETGGYKLFKGKIMDVSRETRGAFNFGKITFEGIGEYKNRVAEVEFQNENLLAKVDGEIVATVPDLICLVDSETFTPVTTDALKYGKRVYVIGLKCVDLWRTEKGLELVGPQYFGCDTEYIPVEIRSKGGNI
ncbi:MAG: DUF917 domain-containing protein, partial [Peptococcaceae bacterium]|nr:DUF917 domain-containing protein [Peptococcaceae bacterium]